MTEPEPAPMQWIITPADVHAGGLSLGTTLRFRARGPLTEIQQTANAIGREAARDKLRSRLAADDYPKLERYRRVQAEAATLDLEARRLDATLDRLRASRAEVIILATPGFSARVMEWDGQIAGMETRAAQARLAADAIAAVVADARAEALALVMVIAEQLHREQYSSLRRRREQILAELPSLIGKQLSELGAIDRALLQGSTFSLAGNPSAALDALTTAAPPPEAAPAASSEPTPVEASATPGEPVAATEPPSGEPAEALLSAPLEPLGPKRRKS
jgi:hypothetical protein